jgi:hypothetical protein
MCNLLKHGFFIFFIIITTVPLFNSGLSLLFLTYSKESSLAFLLKPFYAFNLNASFVKFKL